MPTPYKALVMGDDTRSFLACVRSLGRQGIEVHAAPYSLESPALASRYIQRVHILPYHLDGGHEWLAAMQALLEAEQFDFVLPCEERTLLPLFAHRSSLRPGTVLAIPDELGLRVFFDKWQTRQLAQAHQVPVAKGVLLDSSHTREDLLRDLGLPMVAKHARSYSLPDLYKRTAVKMLRTEGELDEWLKQHPDRSGLFMESVFPGKGLGVSVLSHQGKVVQAFEHHRANELNGSSYYRKSMPLDAARLAAVERLCGAIGYTGLAMFEFKLGANGDWVLLEINARPWGSLPLPVAWGVDFPYLLFQLMCLGQVPSPRAYPSPRYARNLVADLWQLRVHVDQHPRPRWDLVKHVSGWFFSLGRVLINRERHDTWGWDDRAPAWEEWRQFFRMRWQTINPRIGLPPLPALSTLQQAWQRAAQPRLLFLCQGNICRSPYAEHKARQWLGEKGSAVEVSSAGMLPRNARPSPPQALEAAMAMGVNLADHRSRHAHASVLEQATWIVVFDDINRRALHARFPHLADRVVVLGHHATHATDHIADPDGRDVATFEKTYRDIDDCLAHLLLKLPLQGAPAC